MLPNEAEDQLEVISTPLGLTPPSIGQASASCISPLC